MSKANFEELLQAGVHFGHLKRKWNPAMSPYIFMERNGIHIIDLHKTVAKLEEATNAMKQIAYSGKKILFVATKKQARDIVTKRVSETGMPFVTERWTGGMLTNFVTIRKAIKKMENIEKLLSDPEANNISKKERLLLDRQRVKLEKNLGSISELTRLPAALFIIDVHKEHIAVAEAKKLNIPTFAMVDTNSDPRLVDFAIPSNDDASDSIDKILSFICDAVKDGLKERQGMKDKKTTEKPAKEAPKAEAKEAPKAEAKEAPKAEAKEAPKAEIKETPKAEVKETPKAEAKEAPKAEAKEAPKAEVKEAPKAEAKEAPKAEVKEEDKK